MSKWGKPTSGDFDAIANAISTLTKEVKRIADILEKRKKLIPRKEL